MECSKDNVKQREFITQHLLYSHTDSNIANSSSRMVEWDSNSAIRGEGNNDGSGVLDHNDVVVSMAFVSGKNAEVIQNKEPVY
ncbi:hypothetical protein E2542_SST08378 [Spatholobus suberectus]|nr:hypothetical protein E2542_SST08378 [Spatholobus suberectus]